MKKVENSLARDEKGNALLWTMMFVAVFFLIASTITTFTIADIRQSVRLDSSTEAYILAEAGVERAKNYANAEAETFDSNGTGQKGPITGQIGDNQYTFQVVKGGAGVQFDDPPRSCTDNYCYYSQSTVGNIKRKIDGKTTKIDLSRGKSFLQGLPLLTLGDYDTTINVTPDSGVIASPNKLYLRWTVKGINDIPDKSQCLEERCFAFGLFQNGVGSLDVNLEKSGAETSFYLSGNTENTATLRSSATRSATIPSTIDSVTFELTYYMGGATAVKALDKDGNCIDILVRYDLHTQWNGSQMGSYYKPPPLTSDNYKMFFARDATQANVNSGASSGPAPLDTDGFGVTLKSANKSITIKNIFFRVE